MKLTVNQKNLKKAIGLVEKAISRNISLPILNNILFKTENGRLKLAATNLEIGISVMIGARTDEVGDVTIPARIISDFINTISDEKIILTTKNNILSINSDHFKTQILGFDSRDFPIIPKVEEPPLLKVKASILKQALISVLDAMATSESRPELAGVFVSAQNNKATFVSTDSFRLAEKIIPLKINKSKSLILPRNTITELIRICSEVEEDLEVRFKENQVSFSGGDIEIVSRVVDGNYPDYKKIIPDKFVSRVIFDKNELESHLRLAGLFTSAISDVRVQCDNQKTTVVAKNSERGEIETTLNCSLKNEPFEVSLNYKYLLDGIKNIEGDEASLEFTGAGSPLVVRDGGGSSGFTYLIMPLRN